MSSFPNTGIVLLEVAQSQKETSVNQALEIIDALHGWADKAVTGGTVVLTEEEARRGVLQLTGVLASNLTVEYPSTLDAALIIRNATTGAFTAQARYGAGGTLRSLPQGEMVIFYQDHAQLLSAFDSSAADPLPQYQLESEKGAASGYCPLDGSSKVPVANLPDTVVGAVDYKGAWNANTNSPDLPAATPDKGDYYVVSADGSTSLGGITDWKIGDWAIYNGSAWEKVDNSDAAASLLAAHVADSDPHTQYQKESEKGSANGYAGLGSDSRVPIAQLPLPSAFYGNWTAPLAISNWTPRGTAFETAVDDSSGGIFLSRAAQAGTNLAMIARPKSGNYTVTICMVTHLFNVATHQIGVGFYESATGKIVTVMDQRGGGIVVDKWNSNTSFNSSYFFESCRPPVLVWFRLEKTASNLLWYYSHDGVRFFQCWSSTYTNFFTTAPDEYVVAVITNNASRPATARVLSVVEA